MFHRDLDSATATSTDFDDITVVPRSKSSDILKKDSPTVTKLSHFGTLKQWGKNRLKSMHRNSSTNGGGSNWATGGSGGGGFGDDELPKQKQQQNEKRDYFKDKVSDIDDFSVSETPSRNGKKKLLSLDKDRKLSHERKPSYSSSEKSLTTNSQSTVSSSQPASINPVKLRESASIRRQRRSGLGIKDELHSSSGNWSASSESGRTSIGSEITTTTQPKSSASSTSLNHNHHPTSSGPPSSIISRRKFLNTSASSSITSEGTATPELQMYDFHDEGETSSIYSCDTEGYYTSFHVDSGLKTLKEEEPVTPMHSSTALSSTTSFESSGNQTVFSPENEYEMFGKGSTSTTTSSAGTVCTAVLAAENERNLLNGPAVPERKSSLTKLNRSNSTASTGTLERSYSSSTVGSTLERTGTIKRNGILLQKEVAALVHQHNDELKTSRTESPDSGNNTSSSPAESNSNSSPTHGIRSHSELEYSESSDLESVDRIERIRVKTTINTSRIPSMCVITPNNSDDEQSTVKAATKTAPPVVPPTVPPKDKHSLALELKKDVNHFRKATLQPLNNMLGRFKGILPHLKKSPNKDEPVYDLAGDYVTIAEVRNGQTGTAPAAATTAIINSNTTKKKPISSGVYYSNDVVKRNLATVLSGNLNEETEYVSLNELPCNIRCESNLLSNSIMMMSSTSSENNNINNRNTNTTGGSKIDNEGEYCPSKNTTDVEGLLLNRKGARVTLDAQGKVVYNSDSLKRRKGAYTTFAPGPCVKDTTTRASAVLETPKTTITPTNTTSTSSFTSASPSVTIPTSSNTVVSAVSASPLLSGGVINRKACIIRPVISQQKLQSSSNLFNKDTKLTTVIKTTPTSPTSGTLGTSTTANNIPIATVVAQPSTNIVNTSISGCDSGSNSNANCNNNNNNNSVVTNPSSIMQTGVYMKGAYVNVQDNYQKSTTTQHPSHLVAQKTNKFEQGKNNRNLKNVNSKSPIIPTHYNPHTHSHPHPLNTMQSPTLNPLKLKINTNENIDPNRKMPSNCNGGSGVGGGVGVSGGGSIVNVNGGNAVNGTAGLKRSDSYKLANSPLLPFIKTFKFVNSDIDNLEFEKKVNEDTHVSRSSSAIPQQQHKKFISPKQQLQNSIHTVDVAEKIDFEINPIFIKNSNARSGSKMPTTPMNSDIKNCIRNTPSPITAPTIITTTPTSVMLATTTATVNPSPNNKNAKDDSLMYDEGSEYMNVSKTVTRSFEKLMDAFSLTSDDDFLDSDSELILSPMSSFARKNLAIQIAATPNKVTIPSDSKEHKARFLNFTTDIW